MLSILMLLMYEICQINYHRFIEQVMFGMLRQLHPITILSCTFYVASLRMPSYAELLIFQSLCLQYRGTTYKTKQN